MLINGLKQITEIFLFWIKFILSCDKYFNKIDKIIQAKFSN